MSRRGSQTAAAPARPPRRLTCQPPAPLLSLVEAGVAGVAGAVRAEVGVIMATGEASLGASACHLKWHHKRHLTKLGKSKGGYCSARSWHTVVSEATDGQYAVTVYGPSSLHQE